MTKKKRFTNNWKEYRDTPVELFPEVHFDEFMEWRVHGWEILPTHCCIIRIRTNDGKVKEYSYQRKSAAKKRLSKLLIEHEHELIICTDENIQHLKPEKYITEQDEENYYPK